MSKKIQPLTSVRADATEGYLWLQELSEASFRDEILKDLFGKMKGEGVIIDFIRTHGRNEHGVDWIVQEKGGLSNRFVGIQAKSKNITRQGDSRSDSALSVKQQCESAYDHRFNWRGHDIRLDVVELWISAHITADAEEELLAPLSRRKIAVKRSSDIFIMIERYCPGLISRIPVLAETNYLRKFINPESLPIRLLGIPLNPKKHFLEPRFSRHPSLSPSRVFDPRLNKMREEKPIYLKDLLEVCSNTIIVGCELSGKTYLLKRIACLLASQGSLPVYVDGKTFQDHKPSSIPALLREHLSWLSPTSIESPEKLHRQLYLLIDNLDELSATEIAALSDTGHRKITIIGTSKESYDIRGFSTYFFSGIKTDALNGFVRSLDLDRTDASALSDRASYFISRTIGTTGLPINPFTVSMMLSECQISKQRLTTPTMGRLIERFVEAQLGSHLDTLRADFETKMHFLTRIGGLRRQRMDSDEFDKRLSRFLIRHGHAHDHADFEQDLFESGLLLRDNVNRTVSWTHAIFCDFFWIRNLVREKQFKVISKTLIKQSSLSIAAITGSQMGDAHPILRDLLGALKKCTWMNNESKASLQELMDPIGLRLPTDQEEDDILKKLEGEAISQGDEPKDDRGTKKLPSHKDSVSTKVMSSYVKRLLDEKHFLVGNIGALLVNARALTRDDKEAGVTCVLRSNERVSKLIEDIFLSINKDGDAFKVRSLITFWSLLINDMMIGDAFLSEIFSSLMKKSNVEYDRLAITDLQVGCAGVKPSAYVKVLSKNKDLTKIVGTYLRLVMIYYFRCHKEGERKILRDTMKEVRHLAKGFNLPPVPG